MSTSPRGPEPVLTDRLPRVSTAAAGVVGFYLSISPSSLPHGVVLQGVVSALFVIMCVQAMTVVRRAPSRWIGPARVVGLVAMALLALAVGIRGDQALDAARADAGMPLLGGRYWAAVVGIVAAGLLLRHAGQRAWRGRTWSRAVWRPLAAAVVCAGLVLAGGPVHGAPIDDDVEILRRDSPVDAVRTYAEIRPGEDVGARADRAVDELVRSGGLHRSRIVIALPTGSGWVDPRFVTGLEDRFDSDAATVAMQYDSSPSWWSYLVGRKEASTGARALFAEVAERVRELPEDRRPDLHVYGESLGATAGQAIFDGPGAGAARRAVCSALWVGSPGGERVGLPRESTVANPDDPVVHASWTDLLVPSGDDGRWLPVVSGLHGAVDFVGSLDVPVGTGHRYGTRQADALQTC